MLGHPNACTGCGFYRSFSKLWFPRHNFCSIQALKSVSTIVFTSMYRTWQCVDVLWFQFIFDCSEMWIFIMAHRIITQWRNGRNGRNRRYRNGQLWWRRLCERLKSCINHIIHRPCVNWIGYHTIARSISWLICTSCNYYIQIIRCSFTLN